MINRKIFLSGISILSALVLMGGAAFALFTSNATSSDNTFASGTLSLFVDDENEPAVDNTVTTSISASDFAPGNSVSGFISLDNAGTLPFSGIDFTIDTAETADPGNNSDMRTVLNLTVVEDNLIPDSTCTGGADITSAIESDVGDGSSPLTLAEFDNGTDIYSEISGFGTADTRNVCFTVTFDSSAGNIYQGDAVSSTFTFTTKQ